MQDNEFEKQVRDKLARMQMEASDTVWQRVEDGLSGQRKRRRWLIWIPIGAVMLLTGFYFTGRINSDKAKVEVVKSGTAGDRSETAVSKRSPQKPQTPDPSKAPARQTKTLPQNTINGEPKSAEIVVLPQSAKSYATGPRNVEIKAGNRSDVASGSVAEQTPAERVARKASSKIPGVQSANSKLLLGPGRRAEITEPAGMPSSAQTAGDSLPQSSVNQQANDLVQFESTDSISAATVPSNLPLISEIKTADALGHARLPVLKTKRGPSVSAWRWGITATVGRSGITTGKFNSLFYSDVASAPNYSAGNLGNTIVVRPSQVKPSMSLSIGGYAERQIETSTYFKGGLQLSRFSTTMYVGDFKAQPVLLRSTANMADVAIASYYTAEHTRRYTNAYTFIDIPLSLGFNFATRTRLPFAWEIGVAPSILLGSNALHFNQGSSIYYKDNSLFKKSQVALVTSLPINVYNGDKYTLLLVPGFRYNTSNLFLPEINEKKHLLSAGIGLSVKFNK